MQLVADLRLDPLLQRFVERERLGRSAHEQHDADVALPVLADADRLQHLRDLLDLAVDLGRADPHAARVQDGIRAAVDDDAAMAR